TELGRLGHASCCIREVSDTHAVVPATIPYMPLPREAPALSRASAAGLHFEVVRRLGDDLAVLRRAEADLGPDLDHELREHLGDLLVHVEVVEPEAHLTRGRAHEFI